MAINWRELELLLSEMPLEESYIQDVTEHSYHSFTLSLFHKERKAWYLYSEIATPHTRVAMTNIMRKKSATMQRFTQYLKAHVRGKKITCVRQLPYDRAFILVLESPSEKIKLLFRLYSGPGANIIALDEDNTILELMFRRPQRGEAKGEKLIIEERESEGERHFTVRPYSTATFNEAVDREESELSNDEKRDEYTTLLIEKRNRELRAIDERKRKNDEKIERNRNYEEVKHYADLLSSSLYLYRKGMTEITLPDWEKGGDVKLALSEKLDGRGNLNRLYDEYHKEKTAYTLALEEKDRIEEERKETEAKYQTLLSNTTPLDKLRKALGTEKEGSKLVEGKAGLFIKSGEWQIIVGRNAKENDLILRESAKGNDMWMHTRDFAGGYIIIKAQKGKTVPLEVLLDGGYLAVFFSKARKNNRADLYYTQVKNLRRIKGAKTGLIIPTQEKNLTVELDEKRVQKLLGPDGGEK